MKVYTITPSGCAPCTEESPDAIKAWLEDAEPGETFQMYVGEMDKEQFDSMPEYMGP